VNYHCLVCDVVIVNTNVCPLCHTVSTTRSGSTFAIEDVTDEAPARRPKRKFAQSSASTERSQALRLEEPPPRLPPPLPSRISSSSYALAHTLGRCHFDPHGGDGAYSRWMHEYFSDHRNAEGCVHVDRLHYTGAVGNAKASGVARTLNPAMCKEFDRFLSDESLNRTNTVILNWHIRFTGTPNGWTGRGVSPTLINRLKEMARAKRKKLAVIYTVHEYSELSDKLKDPSALVALNPDVSRSLGADFRGVRIARSRVPGLMTSLHTSSVDQILRFMGTPTHGAEAHNLISGCLLQRLRLLNEYSHDATLRATSGIVLFGMITQRHGTTVANVSSLCTALDSARLPAPFKVIIVGKTQEPSLERDLRALAATTPRLTYHGLLNSFNDLVGSRYAISFDPLGFRHNASAMVNVTRAGHLLFSRRGGESDRELMARTAQVIRMCERNPSVYAEMLAAQQPRFRSTSPLIVGFDLDRLFREVAAIAHERGDEKSPRD